MDSLTQIVLGGAVGEAILGKKIGNRAVLWGAIGGTIPDLDIISKWFMSQVDSTLFHRSLSHSIFFCVLASPLMAWLLQKIYRKENISFKSWTFFFFMSFFTHALLDCFTTWGTQLFWPFSDYPVAFKSIFVIDPIYTLPFMGFLIAAMTMRKTSRRRRQLNYIGLTLSSAYLMLTLINKQAVNGVFEKAFADQQLEVERYETKPTPLNNILWNGTAESQDEFLMGYYSLLDEKEEIQFLHFPKNHDLLKDHLDDTELQKLIKISTGYYTVQPTGSDTLIFNDLRFGQASGWQDGSGDFVFSYFYVPPSGNQPSFIQQRPNSFSDAGKMFGPIWDRMLGN